jgi:hypothetical protein
MARLGRNLRTGLRWGVAYSAVYSAYVVGLWVFRGDAPFEHNNTTLGAVLLAYWGSGVLVGAMVGILLPFGVTWYGAAVLGVLGAYPTLYLILVGMQPRSEWFTSVPLMALLGSTIVGPMCGIGLWRLNRDA